MPVVLTPADDDVIDLLRIVLARHERFAPILEHKLRIEVLMASNDGKPALRLGRSHPLALVKKVGVEEKAILLGEGFATPPDVRIKIDERRFLSLGRKSRMAVFAHELNHILIPTKTGLDNKQHPKLDSYGRPKFDFLDDDYTVTGFAWVADEYGEDSIEIRSYHAIAEILGQQGFAFMRADSSVDQAEVKAAVDRDDELDRTPIRGEVNDVLEAEFGSKAPDRADVAAMFTSEANVESTRAAAKDWPSTSIAFLGIESPEILGSLARHGVATVGQLGDALVGKTFGNVAAHFGIEVENVFGLVNSYESARLAFQAGWNVSHEIEAAKDEAATSPSLTPGQEGAGLGPFPRFRAMAEASSEEEGDLESFVVWVRKGKKAVPAYLLNAPNLTLAVKCAKETLPPAIELRSCRAVFLDDLTHADLPLLATIDVYGVVVRHLAPPPTKIKPERAAAKTKPRRKLVAGG